jgi:hypothetical protein
MRDSGECCRLGRADSLAAFISILGAIWLAAPQIFDLCYRIAINGSKDLFICLEKSGEAVKARGT